MFTRSYGVAPWVTTPRPPRSRFAGNAINILIRGSFFVSHLRSAGFDAGDCGSSAPRLGKDSHPAELLSSARRIVLPITKGDE